MVQFFVQIKVQISLGVVQKCCKLHLEWCKKVVQTRCNLHMFLHLHGCKRGAICTCFCTCMVHMRCTLHMVLHLDGEEAAHVKCKLHAFLHMQVQTFGADDVQHVHVLSK